MRTVATMIPPPERRAVEVSLFPELRANRAVGPLPNSVVVGNNAALVAAVRGLYLLGSVLDVTYGRGGWWRDWEPTEFLGHDIATDGVDFRHLPHADRSWDAVVFDPPYVPQGGPSTDESSEDFRDRYGITTPRTQAALEALIAAGLAEAARVARRFVLIKCMDYVTGGRFVPMTYRVAGVALELGLKFHDEIILNAGTGPGGHNIETPLRARRNHSKLLVFAVPRSRR